MTKAYKKYSGAGLPVKIAQEYYSTYDSAEFTVANGQTNYDVKTNVANAFSNIDKCHSMLIRTDRDITIRFNGTSNHAVTLTAVEGSLNITREMGLEMTSIYTTNASGATANVKIMVFE